ncbi:ABC transporter permease [Clostridiaceae bacterium M8S5]|nr:ABC transporter permease [Clostridiaceae bacterium M8S5]
MKPYFSLFKIRLLKGLQYKIPALAGILTQFFWGFISIMVFEAFYKSSSSAPMPLNDLVDYLWLRQGFLILVMLWFKDNELFNHIKNGTIAYELCRPTDLYTFWYAKLIAQRLSGAVLRCLPILIIGMLLPEPFKLNIPPNIISFILFIITLLLGLVLTVAISMLLYISVFYTMSPVGSQMLFGMVGDFFSGILIPIPFMPKILKTIAQVLPFSYACDLPFRIYSGNLNPKEAVIGLGFQIIWIVIIIALGKFWMSRALKKVIVQGG